MGYGDGWPRALGNRGCVLIRGNRVRIIGRISMDMIVVDVTGLETVSPGDEVTLIGRDGDEEITVDEVAAQVDTISYEILTGLTPRLPRLERA
jgi:alanine racemase